jgi:hypothetical protein
MRRGGLTKGAARYSIRQGPWRASFLQPIPQGGFNGSIDVYNQFAAVCRENGDSISMKLFETIIDEEQIHYNYFDNVDEHITDLGDTYLAKIAGTPSATGLTPKGFAVGTGGA